VNASTVAPVSRFAVRGRIHAREVPPSPCPPRARKPRRRPLVTAAIALLVALAAWQLGAAAWIHAKARLAQHLIAVSWSDAREGVAPPPWPWADTRPIARLTVPGRHVSLYVLAGTSGRSLAFGPGHVDGTAMPGSAGNSVIVAHRDTHFAFLKDLRQDEEIDVEDARGRSTRYRVREVAIVDQRETRVLDPADSPQLTLITCWPFEAVRPGTHKRYVVIADRVA
jgi:sortase A